MEPEKVLQLFLALLEHSADNQEALREMYQDNLLAPGFDDLYALLNKDKGFAIIKSVFVSETQLHYILQSRTFSLLHRVVLEKAAVWRISSFMWQCLACFGDEEQGTCGCCGDSGWGLT